jgi:hypothetical protein
MQRFNKQVAVMDITMNITLRNQVPTGEELTQAVMALEEAEHLRQIKAQIQRGLDAANDPAAPRTAHVDFMAELKAELLSRINAR